MTQKLIGVRFLPVEFAYTGGRTVEHNMMVYELHGVECITFAEVSDKGLCEIAPCPEPYASSALDRDELASFLKEDGYKLMIYPEQITMRQ